MNSSNFKEICFVQDSHKIVMVLSNYIFLFSLKVFCHDAQFFLNELAKHDKTLDIHAE